MWAGYAPEENTWLARLAVKGIVALDHHLDELKGKIKLISPTFQDDIQCEEACYNTDQRPLEELESLILHMRSLDLEMTKIVNDFTSGDRF